MMSVCAVMCRSTRVRKAATVFSGPVRRSVCVLSCLYDNHTLMDADPLCFLFDRIRVRRMRVMTSSIGDDYSEYYHLGREKESR